MTGEIALIGGGVILTLAGIQDFSKTVALGASALTIFGVTFIAKKVTEPMNKNYSDIINMAGWCLTGIPLVGILVLAKQSSGIEDIINFFKGVGNFFNGASGFFSGESVPGWLKDFWNFGNKEQIQQMINGK